MSRLFEDQDELVAWLTGPGLRFVLIIAAAFVLTILVRRVIAAAIRPEFLGAPGTVENIEDMERRARREETVESFIIRTAVLLIWVIALLTALGEVGIKTGPMIASAGMVGLAIGFGAQTLVKDAIAGIFLLTENHYDIGDRVRLNGIEGEVSGISIRRTTIRGDAGEVHTLPNGSITLTTNLSRDINRVDGPAAPDPDA